jgi:hypothetical protein
MSPKNDSAIHIQAVRRALANGNAAVMVGAGFSRNAEGGNQLKMWNELGRELWTSLNPSVTRTEFPPTLVTQLAEQYARVFSTPALEDLLKQHIPDDRVAPGRLHLQLLDLAWCEIFTTNYDTLLERAAEQLLDRAHFTVCCREDIPQSKILGRRRIVKLHGSFPSHRPFIFTEEDYRQYPQRFAPFVNLVRQSLLENVVCLIGFSGDDPNFLHWIGWVRDMLDQHALPIYLFTNREPTFGERKLLEVRRVTPVTLPLPNGNEDADYAQRLAELFRQLAEPLKPRPSEWGEVHWPPRTVSGDETNEERFEWLLSAFPRLLALRESYPGWMVAPHAVRQRLKSAIDGMPVGFEDGWVLRYLDEQPPAVGMVFLSHYAWVQDTLLLPLLDPAAQLGMRVLQATARLVLANESEACRSTLERLGVIDQQALDRCWRQLALGLVQWARQSMHATLFNELCVEVRATWPQDVEAEASLQYEAILLALYQGERQQARLLLTQWDVSSSDPYTIFRKGVLLAEVDNLEAALELCSEAIQLLRRLQKIRPESALLLSQEAWACLVLSRMRRGWKFLSTWSMRVPKTDEEADNLLKRRQLDLAAKGFEARADLNATTAALNAEATPPSEPRYEAGDFDLGRVRTFRHLTWSSELTEKVNAAFTWLTLAERVGLVPRFGEIASDPASFTKAAWWIQFNDSTRRMLSVVIRTMSTDIFKPKDQSLPSGRTGWLSRYQIARLDLQFAQEMCERSLRQVEVALAAHVDAERTCSFYVELFSRLVLRIEAPDEVQAMAQRVIALHSQIAVDEYSRLWSVFARALARCFEATPGSLHLQLVGQVNQVPLLPHVTRTNHFLDDWLQLHGIEATIPEGQAIPASLSNYVDRLIEDLREHRNDAQRSRALWKRLLWLDDCRALSVEQRRELGEILWRGTDTWPLIPGYQPAATSVLPPPDGVGAAERFRHWILDAGVTGFRQPSMMFLTMKAGGAGWGLPGDHTFFKSWITSLRTEPWPEDAWQSGLLQINRWWAAEAEDLARDIVRHDDLAAALTLRLDLIDTILGRSELWALAAESDEIRALILGPIAVMTESARSMGAPFWRFRIHQARYRNDAALLSQVEQEVAAALVSSRDAATLQKACAAARLWIEMSIETQVPAGLILDTTIALFVSRSVPSLAHILGLLITLLQHGSKVLDGVRSELVAMALKALLEELNYEGRPVGSAIPDEEVPTLRFLCARLSFLIITMDAMVDTSAAQRWIDVAKADPLPEMRFRRYQVNTSDDTAV